MRWEIRGIGHIIPKPEVYKCYNGRSQFLCVQYSVSSKKGDVYEAYQISET